MHNSTCITSTTYKTHTFKTRIDSKEHHETWRNSNECIIIWKLLHIPRLIVTNIEYTHKRRYMYFYLLLMFLKHLGIPVILMCFKKALMRVDFLTISMTSAVVCHSFFVVCTHHNEQVLHIFISNQDFRNWKSFRSLQRQISSF